MSRPLPRYQHTDPTEWDRKLARILGDTTDTETAQSTKRAGYRSPEGDEQRLRLIPVIARGVAGHIPGTRP